jgi:signal transduction histidine kinase
MSHPGENKAFELLKEKFDRHEKILVQAYHSLKSKEKELLRLNQELHAREIELYEANEELRVTNEELQTAYEEIKTHNDNLDELVKMRSQRIEEQLSLFHEYAHINSHEVRAPLARLLGLLNLLEYDNNKTETISLIGKLKESAKELDDVVRNMNRLLEKGAFPKISD